MKICARIIVLGLALFSLSFNGCSSSSGVSSVNPDAVPYAKFGEELNDLIPPGLKTGGVNADIALSMVKALSGTCADDFTDCPYVTASGGGDSSAAEILMRLWGLDYNDECVDSLFTDGTCFTCADCQTGSMETTNFIKPTMISDPTSCVTTSTTAGRYVNFDVDPCFFDTMIGQISNIAECETIQGGSVDISSVVPWYASWGISQTVNFSSYYSRTSGGGIWWTVNGGSSGNDQYFLSLDTNWLYAGIKDVDNNRFLFLGTGSPAYYAGRGEGSGVNISAYAGPLSTITSEFEAIQVRVQDPNKYIERLRSNGEYLWYQSWSGTDFPDNVAEAEAVKNSPTADSNRCLHIGDKVVNSEYVPLADCVTAFGAASVDALNEDDNYTLKIIDGETASAINFSAELTPTSSSTCLPSGE